MKSKYQGNKKVQSSQLQRMRRNFEVLEMREGDSITEYFSRVMVVANDMRNLGENIPDAKVVEKIMRTLVEKYTYVVCAIEESKDITEMTVDELQSSLLVHEQNLIKHPGDEQVLKRPWWLLSRERCLPWWKRRTWQWKHQLQQRQH